MIQGELITWNHDLPTNDKLTHLLLYAPDGQMEFFVKDNGTWKTRWTYSTITGVHYGYR